MGIFDYFMTLFDWFMWVLFASIIDLMDLYIGMLSGVAIGLIDYLLNVCQPFVKFINEMRGLAKPLFLISLLCVAVSQMFLARTTLAKKMLNGIIMSTLCIALAVPIVDLAQWVVNETLPVAGKFGDEDNPNTNRRGLANALTYRSEAITNPDDCTGVFVEDGDWYALWMNSKTGTFYNGAEESPKKYIVGVRIPLGMGETKIDIENKMRASGIDPTNEAQVFPNGKSGGFIDWKNNECAIGTKANYRFLYTGCAIAGENQGVIRYWKTAPIWLVLVFGLILLIACVMITFKLIDACYEFVFAGALLPVSSALVISDIGRETWKNNVKELFTNAIGLIVTVLFTSLMFQVLGNLIQTSDGGGIAHIINIISHSQYTGGVNIPLDDPLFKMFFTIILQIALILATAFFIINGSDVIKRMVGFDTGLQSAAGALIASRAAGAVGKGVGKMVGKGKNALLDKTLGQKDNNGGFFSRSKVANAKSKIGDGINNAKDGVKSVAKNTKNAVGTVNDARKHKKLSKTNDNGVSGYDKKWDKMSNNKKEMYSQAAQEYADVVGGDGFWNSMSQEEQEQFTKDFATGKMANEKATSDLESAKSRISERSTQIASKVGNAFNTVNQTNAGTNMYTAANMKQNVASSSTPKVLQRRNERVAKKKANKQLNKDTRW